MNIGVLLGGDSAEREVSMKSGRAVLDALLRLGHHVEALDLNLSQLPNISSQKYDLLF